MLTGFVVVAVIGILTLIVRFLLAHIKISQIINKIPGPPGLPLFGNALGFKHGGAEFFEQLCGFCEDYGRKDGIMKFWLGTHPVIALTSGEAAETVFNSSKHMSKSVMYRFVHPWLGTGLLTSTGAKWQFRRKHLTPTFHFKILNDFQVVFNEQTKVLVDKLDTMAGKGEFDIFPFITRCALDIICETAMGCNIEAQANSDSDYVKAVYKIGELIQQRLKKPWWWPNVIFNNLPAGKEHQKCLDILQGFTRKVIIERQGELENMLKTSDKASPQQVTMSDQDIDDQMEMYAKKGKKRMAFLDMLLYSARGENGMTFEGIQEEVDTFMFEGHDTTAGSMNWTCHLIGSYPDVQKKLQNEIDSVMKDKDHTITANDLKEFKYLDRVIKESLRIFPSVPMFGREISEDTNIAGYDIPKGTTAIVLPYSLHRDPRYFPDPEKFDITQTFANNASSFEDDVTESFIGPTITFMPHGCKFSRPILVFLKIPEELLDTSGRYEYVVLYSDTTNEDPYACEWDELSSYEEGHVSGVVLPEHGLAVLSLNHFCKFGILKRLKEKMMEVQVYSNYDRVDNEIKLTCLLCPENYSESKEYQEARRKIGGTLVQHAMTVVYSDKYSIDLSVSSICQSWVDEDGNDNTQSIPHMLVWDGHFPSREFTFIPSSSSSLSRLTCKITVVQSSYEAATLKIKVRPEECQMDDSPSDRRDSMSRPCPREDSGIFGEVDDSSTSPGRSADKEDVILPTTLSVTPLHSTTNAPWEIRLLCTGAARNSCGSDNGEISQLSVSLGPLLAPYNGPELNTIEGNVTKWIGENAPLRNVYHSVVNEMNPEPVLDILFQDKFIQLEQLEQLRGLVTSHDKNRRILRIILRMDPKTFADILERCGQKDLANQVRDI